MSHDADHMAETLCGLIGGTITGTVLIQSKDEWDGNQYGLNITMPDGTPLVAVVNSDSEGNDAGWIDVYKGDTPRPTGIVFRTKNFTVECPLHGPATVIKTDTNTKKKLSRKDFKQVFFGSNEERVEEICEKLF